ncbi:galectin-7 isoform X2 [Condylostylus longicornis]|uniref:galectin-7 isoform X2 n=1 Tax=Condylostylus longicornis TaxID=2530218 RepID=UPI00244E422C|nr:galectin-7 isoform X2 [Condylostylus longicornis]
MSERPLFAILPKSLKSGDEVIIKGHLNEDARQFSVNFTLDSCSPPQDVLIHFKVDFTSNEIIFNSKEDGSWNEEEVKIENEFFDENEPFMVLFHFDNRQVLVYALTDFESDISRNFVEQFDLSQYIDNIQTVQVWGDVSKIDELTFRYS